METDANERARIDRTLKDWRQGDCVLGPQWFVFRIDSQRPLTEAGAEAAAEGIEVVEEEVRGLVVTTQTCDIVRACDKQPLIEVAALVEIDANELPNVQSGHRPTRAFVPGVAEHGLVADLDRSMTVEKALVAGWMRVRGCRTEGESRRLALALARKRNRTAFPDDFHDFSSRFRERMTRKHQRQTTEGEALRALREIRVRAAPSWEADAVELTFFFIAVDNDPRGQAWDEHVKAWLDLLQPRGRFTSVQGLAPTLDELTARDYVESDVLDLGHLSSREARRDKT